VDYEVSSEDEPIAKSNKKSSLANVVTPKDQTTKQEGCHFSKKVIPSASVSETRAHNESTAESLQEKAEETVFEQRKQALHLIRTLMCPTSGKRRM
jgi:hypothetical protein